MELRTTEKEIESVTEFYLSLQSWSTTTSNKSSIETAVGINNDDGDSNTTIITVQLPPLIQNQLMTDDVNNKDGIKHDTVSDSTTLPTNSKLPERNDHELLLATTTTTTTTTTPTTAIRIRNDLYQFQQRMMTLHGTVTKFHQRLQLLDPITQQPRYGTQTKQRVVNVIQSYTQLIHVYNQIFSPPIHSINITNDNTSEIHSQQDISAHSTSDDHLIAAIERVADKERMEEEQRLELERQQTIAATEARQQVIMEQQRQQELEASLLRQRQLDEFRQQTEHMAETRRVIQAEQDRQAMADRMFMENIPNRNTIAGVQEQLQRFVSNWKMTTTANESPPPPPPSTTIQTSLRALHTVLAQIVSHPDNESYRRIRRNHPQFMNDIGQYHGGIEILVCAGFTMGMMMDDNNNTMIPSYVCKEPNIETDLDGWSNWYDLLKGTLQLIEQEMK